MIGYKAFDRNLCCREFQFEVGKTYSTGYKKEELKLCSNTVFHFCRELQNIEHYSPYRLSISRVCEIIATGDIVYDDSDGIDTKYGTNKIVILRELTKEEIAKYTRYNMSHCNIGTSNKGSWNAGTNNCGNHNTGNRNNGYFNTGGGNVGNNNAGYCNEGDHNTGDYNRGNQNVGCWNSCDGAYGFFNTEKPKLRMFNKPVDVDEEKLYFPHFLRFALTQWVSGKEASETEKLRHRREIQMTGGFLKTLEYEEAFALAYKKADKKEHEQLFVLPNFNPVIFEEISGIDVMKEYNKWKEETI